ncbi:MAG: Ig-like domain-containing protein, partial [Actinomycetota bacterium]
MTTALTYTTNERINAAAVGPGSAPVFAVLTGVGTFQLAGSYSVDASGTVVTFTVTGAFPSNATIQWYTNNNSTIRNMAGLLLPNQLAQFTTANTPDVDGPTVQAVSPANGATDVGPFATVTLTFSESVNPNTVTASTVALFAGSHRLSVGLTRSLDNRMVFLTTTLPAESTITVIATSGVTDVSGNALANFSSTFTTSQAVDTSRPSVITQRPLGSGVSTTTPITLFVNKPLNPSTVTGAIFVSQNGALISGTTTVDSANQAIVFVPSIPYTPASSVEISLTAAVRDVDGNALIPYHGTFAIGSDPATSAPALRRTNPVQFSSNNPTTTVIDLEFTEAINPATVTSANVFLRDATNAPVAGTLSIRAGNRVIRFTPAAPFAVSNYNYVFYTSQLLDLQGNAVAGSNFYFYTGATGDSTNPSVSAIVPGGGATGVGVNSSIRVAFSEGINPTSITPETVTVSAGGTPLGTTMSLGSGNQTITVTPQRPLPAGTLITVSVNGVDDPSGHAVPVTSTSFTTGTTPDITAPVIEALSIPYGDTNVPVNSIFEWIYNEPLDATSVLSQQNILYDYGVGAYIQGGTLSLSADLRRVTYVPPANLAPGHQHLVSLSTVADLAGNFGGAASALFTT